MSTAQWEELLKNNNWNNVSLRDARYDQVIHLVREKSFIDQFSFAQSVWLFTCKFALTTSSSTSMLFYSSDNCSSHEGLPLTSFCLCVCVFSACIAHVCSQLVSQSTVFAFPPHPFPYSIKLDYRYGCTPATYCCMHSLEKNPVCSRQHSKIHFLLPVP